MESSHKLTNKEEKIFICDLQRKQQNHCKYTHGVGDESLAPEKHDEDITRTHKTDTKERLRFGNLPRDRQLLLVFCVLSHFMSGLSTSLLAPFYPQKAQEKGMSITLVGVTFSIFPLTNSFTSPLFSSYMTTIGPRLLLISGMIVGGVCNVLYGLLDKCPPGMPFIVISLACRFIEALGFSAYVNANLTLSVKTFPDHAATVMAFIQMASELGLMLGPAIGGVLFDIGGFGTPFYVVGVLVVFNGLIMYFIIPPTISTDKPKSINKCFLFRNSLILISMITIATGSLGIGFLESTLANHLAPLHVSTTLIGLIFAICPLLFTISSPLYGFLTDTKGLETYLIVFGLLVFGLGLLFVGPAAIFPTWKLDVWSVIIGLVLIGASFGCALIPTMKCLINGSLESGCEETTDTYAAVSGINTSMYFFGSFLGPLLGRALIPLEGYSYAYTMIGGWCICVCILSVIVFFYRRSVVKYKMLP